MIIGISGKKQSGKDTVAFIWQLLDVWYNNYKEEARYWHEYKKDFICDDISFVNYFIKEDDKNNYPSHSSDWVLNYYAKPLKQILSIIFNCSTYKFDYEDFKNSRVDPCWALTSKNKLGDIGYIPTYREMLQYIGTDLFREHFGNNIWIKILFMNYQDYQQWIIPDVRFLNEVESIKERNGIIINVTRDNKQNIDTHISETSLDNYNNFDYTINNNGSIIELINKVKEIMIKEKIIS